jgi:hypothetical protein
VSECRHEELEFLGDQKSEGGYNKYYRCKLCRHVIVIMASGDRAIVLPPA